MWTLDVASRRQPPARTSPRPGRRGGARAATGAARAVLIVEDHAEVREMYGAYLRACGLVVYEAANGKQGVDEARRLRPDVILMDLAMPGLTGWEATRRIRRDPQIGGVPVIAMTAYSGMGFEWLAAEAGCDSLLSKPCRPLRVLQEIEDVLARRRASGPGPVRSS
jgi:two-component system, cell cycle response regulator DivK